MALAVRRLNTRGHLHALLALDQFRHQPVGFFARALPDFEEIHQRIARARVHSEFQPRLAHTLRHHGLESLRRAQAFSSATVNTYTEPGLAFRSR